jgi:UDP-galactopyranose mutase
MLSAASWDTTQARMAGLIAELMGTRTAAGPALLVAAE